MKSAAKYKIGTTLIITKKNFQNEELSHELFLTTRQKSKTRKSFSDNMLTNIKLNKAHLSKIIKSSSGFFGKTLDLAVPFAKDIFPKLATKATLSVLNKFERTLYWQGAVRAAKRIYFIYLKSVYR